MKTDFFRDKKTIIIICVAILVITAASAITIVILSSTKDSSNIITETAEEMKIREEKTRQEAELLEKLNNASSLSAEERANINKQLEALRTK